MYCGHNLENSGCCNDCSNKLELKETYKEKLKKIEKEG